MLHLVYGQFTKIEKKLENMLKYLSKKNFGDMKFCLRSMLDAYLEFILVVSGPKNLQIARSPPTKFYRLMAGIPWKLTHHVELANVKLVCRNFKKLRLGIMQKIEEILINTNEWRSS